MRSGINPVPDGVVISGYSTIADNRVGGMRVGGAPGKTWDHSRSSSGARTPGVGRQITQVSRGLPAKRVRAGDGPRGGLVAAIVGFTCSGL